MPISIKDLIVNPDNPRLIKDKKFKTLCKSIKDFPRMLELRPIVIDDNNVILGGNMRLEALKQNGYTELPDGYVKRACELTEAQKKEFIVKDNVPFGEWDMDLLANNFDDKDLLDWGLDNSDFGFDSGDDNIKEKEIDENIQTENKCPKCGYEW